MAFLCSITFLRKVRSVGLRLVGRYHVGGGDIVLRIMLSVDLREMGCRSSRIFSDIVRYLPHL
jgi:hypothetical protein